MVYRDGSQGSIDENTLDAIFSALAHRARRDVLRRLARQGEVTGMSGLAAVTGVSPQLLNKHAAVLQRAGLITREARGRETHVSIRPEVLAEAQRWIEQMTAYWNVQLESLDGYVAALRRDAAEEGAD